VHIEFTEASLQSLFDDLYAAETVEVRVKSKWNGAELVRTEENIEEVEGKSKTVKQFVYRVTQPTGPFLKQYITSAPEAWLKLWRDMLWTIPRGNPQSREPFEQRASGVTCKEGPNAWSDLLKAYKAAEKNEIRTDAVAGSLWLGAQASNAENIPFKGRVEETLLLHFWPITSMVFVPQQLDRDGKSEFVGYVLAIPEVSDLPRFMNEYRRMLGNLPVEMRGFRPAAAVIDLPAEGALLFLEHLAQLSQAHVADSEIQSSASSIEFLHQVKVGNNIKSLGSGRIIPRRDLLNRYLEITGAPGRKPPYGNPLFRVGLLQALLNDEPWYRHFGLLFSKWPHAFFVHSDDSSPKLPWFSGDVRNYLHKEIFPMLSLEDSDDPGGNDALLMHLIYRLVRSHLTERARKKFDIDLEKFKEEDKVQWDKVPKEYKDARQSAGTSLFLEFRSRREQAFVDHFAQTLFSAKQFLTEAQYAMIGHALLHRTDDVKTLTLMALSANS